MKQLHNLKNMRVYLVGAMDRVPDGGVGWRNSITPHLLEFGLKVLNPCSSIKNIEENENSRKTIEQYKKLGQYEKIKQQFSIIRNNDLRCVDISDFLICHIDLEIHACGSYEEIATANRQKKPILVVCKQGKDQAPNWLFFMLPHEHIFSNVEDLLHYLKKVNTHKDKQNLSRWFFLKDDQSAITR